MLCQKDAMYWLYWNSSDILEHFDKIWQPAWRPLCCDSPFQRRQDLRNAFDTSWYIIVHPCSISVEDPYPIPLTRKRFPALHAENIRKRQSIKTSFQSHCKLSDRVYVCFFLILLIFFYLLAWYSMPWSWSFSQVQHPLSQSPAQPLRVASSSTVKARKMEKQAACCSSMLFTVT